MNNTFNDKSTVEMDGHVLIKDADSGEVLLDKHNHINFENMSEAMAGGLVNAVDTASGEPFHIEKLAYGNGGTAVSGTGAITYNTPNTTSADGELYNETYIKAVNVSPFDNENNISVEHENGQHYTDIKITSTLDYTEPSGQNSDDTGTDMEDDYVFDEIGLKLKTGKFITHLIFHPIEKAANRKIQVIYTLRIRAGN
jgi:hypothetical protein